MKIQTLAAAFACLTILSAPAMALDISLGASVDSSASTSSGEGSGLSVGLGAKFINFKSDNPSQIISGFGGSMLLVSHLTYLTGVGIFLFVSKDPQPVNLCILAAVSVLAGILPIKAGIHSMQRLEY